MSQKFTIIQYLPLTRSRATRRFLNKLDLRNVHAILDLEDSAQDPFDLEKTRELKKEARLGLLKISESFDENYRSKIYIRINSANSEYFNEDLAAVISSKRNGMPIDGIFLPKTEEYSSIENIYHHFDDHLVDIDIVPMIETQLGYENLEKILIADNSKNLISKVHYGHFDYSLDAKLWPFPDPNHYQYWEIIKPMIVLLQKYKRTYIHTPFPFPNDTSLFWSSQNNINSILPNLDFWSCTLNLELSLSDCPDDITLLECEDIDTNEEILVKKAKQIIEEYYQGRVNKRSFSMSSKRFIPPHQAIAAQKYLQRVKP
jgi:citrate lyase beta subunit